MTWLMEIALSNLAMAAAIAMVAALVGRTLRRPALTHALWLLVFLKLITPPLAPLPMGWLLPSPLISEASVEPADRPKALGSHPKTSEETETQPKDVEELFPDRVVDDVPHVVVEQPLPAENIPAPAGADTIEIALPSPSQADKVQASQMVSSSADSSSSVSWLWIGAALWLGGSAAWFVLAGVRISRFQRVVRLGRPAPPALLEEARSLAERLGIACPAVWLVPGRVSPMLCVSGRAPRLLVPEKLLDRLGADQRRALLAHELAHWVRRDHWVRRIELVVLGLYWWCPLVWWARAELEQAEEECCDAWVIWTLPGVARDYALALLETIDFLSGAKASLPPFASGMGQVRHFRRRLTMILGGQTPRALTVWGCLAVLALGALLLPWVPSWGQSPPPREYLAQRETENLDPNSPRDNKEDLEKARRELRQMQADLDRIRQEIERRGQELKKMIDRDTVPEEKGKGKGKGPRDWQGEKNKDGTPKGPNDFGNPWRGPVPEAKPWGPGGPGGPGGTPGGPGMGGGDMNRRLDSLEKKMDDLLKEIRDMRKGMPKGQPGRPAPQATPPGTPGGPLIFPRGDSVPPPAAPAPLPSSVVPPATPGTLPLADPVRGPLDIPPPPASPADPRP